MAKDVSKEACKKAKKLMDQVKRLGEKERLRIPAERLQKNQEEGCQWFTYLL